MSVNHLEKAMLDTNPETASKRFRAVERTQPEAMETPTPSPRRTLFLAFYTVNPPTGGASSVSLQLARHWAGERMLVQTGDAAELSEAGLQVTTLRAPGNASRLQKLRNVAGWIRQMTAVAEHYQPDTIVLEGASWAAYHWRLLTSLRRAMPDVRYIYHAHNVEYDIRRQKNGWIIAVLTRFCEWRVLAKVDVATSVSGADAERFRVLYDIGTVPLPNGVDAASFRDAHEDAVQALRARLGLDREVVLFMGSYAFRPNREAIDFLVGKVFPDLLARRPAAQLLILGGDVPYERSWLIAPGLVPAASLPSYVRTAAVSAAPIFSGSGTRLKILESLAAGIPVVSSCKGMEGLPLEPGTDILRAESAGDFVDALERILADPGAARGRTLSVTQRIAASFDWPEIVRRFEHACDEAGGRRDLPTQTSRLSRDAAGTGARQ